MANGRRLNLEQTRVNKHFVTVEVSAGATGEPPSQPSATHPVIPPEVDVAPHIGGVNPITPSFSPSIIVPPDE